MLARPRPSRHEAITTQKERPPTSSTTTAEAHSLPLNELSVQAHGRAVRDHGIAGCGPDQRLVRVASEVGVAEPPVVEWLAIVSGVFVVRRRGRAVVEVAGDVRIVLAVESNALARLGRLENWHRDVRGGVVLEMEGFRLVEVASMEDPGQVARSVRDVGVSGVQIVCFVVGIVGGAVQTEGLDASASVVAGKVAAIERGVVGEQLEVERRRLSVVLRKSRGGREGKDACEDGRLHRRGDSSGSSIVVVVGAGVE